MLKQSTLPALGCLSFPHYVHAAVNSQGIGCPNSLLTQFWGTFGQHSHVHST